MKTLFFSLPGMRIFFSARIWNFLKKWQLINEKAEKMQF